MDLPEAVQLAALQAVLRHKQRKLNPLDLEYSLRRIFRWYSEKFHTALDRVDDLPLSDVLQAYWECHYEEMDDKDIEDERLRLIEDEESLKLRQIDEDENEVEVWEIAQEEKSAQAAAGPGPSTLEQAVHAPKDAPILSFGPRDKEAQLVNAAPEQSTLPDIRMTFGSEDDIDLDADTFGLLADPKSRK